MDVPKLQGGNADSRLSPQTDFDSGRTGLKTKRPAAFGDAALWKKPFAEQFVVCDKNFSSGQLVTTEFPSVFNILLRSPSYDYGNVLSILFRSRRSCYLIFTLSGVCYIFGRYTDVPATKDIAINSGFVL